MKTLLVSVTLLAVSLWIAPSTAQQQPRYQVDPQTNWAVGAKRKPAEELKKELQDFVRRELAPYKYPRKIEFVQELPKTTTGKIRRSELRDSEFRVS